MQPGSPSSPRLVWGHLRLATSRANANPSFPPQGMGERAQPHIQAPSAEARGQVPTSGPGQPWHLCTRHGRSQ